MTYNEIVQAWNEQADEFNYWENLGEDEKIEFCIKVVEKRMDIQCDKHYRNGFGAGWNAGFVQDNKMLEAVNNRVKAGQ